MRMKLANHRDHPKLTLTTLPAHHKPFTVLPPGMITPPLHPAASVPFHWEEVPGRPRVRPNLNAGPSPRKPKSARPLGLPPRHVILAECEVTDLPSPTTVLNGLEGDAGGGSFDSLENGGEEEVEVKVKITRLLRRRGSMYRLTHRSSQVFENIYGSLRQIIWRGHPNGKRR